MSEPTPSLLAETEALKGAYAALNRNDIPGFAQLFDSQIEWIDPVEDPSYGTYRGLAAVVAHTIEARARWAEGSCEPVRLIVAGDKIVVFVDVRVRLKDEVQWREGRPADVYTFRNGKVVQARSFLDRQRGLQWAGATAPDAI